MKLNLLEKLLVTNPVRDYFLHTREAPRLFNTLPKISNGRYLELGCGNGTGALTALCHLKPGILVSLDIDPDMLTKARKKSSNPPQWATDTDVSRLHFVLSDSGHLPFPDQSFDAGFHFFLLDHLPDWRHVIVEIHRVLKNGGVYIFEDYLIPDSVILLNNVFGHVPIKRDELIQAFSDTGFIFDDLKYSTSNRHCFMRLRK